MDATIKHALAHDRVIDITTIGRQSGQPRRLEIWFHNLDGAMYITGLPGKRSWYANLVAHPSFTFHLKDSTRADLPARAYPVTDPVTHKEKEKAACPPLGASRPQSVASPPTMVRREPLTMLTRRVTTKGFRVRVSSSFPELSWRNDTF